LLSLPSQFDYYGCYRDHNHIPYQTLSNGIRKPQEDQNPNYLELLVCFVFLSRSESKRIIHSQILFHSFYLLFESWGNCEFDFNFVQNGNKAKNNINNNIKTKKILMKKILFFPINSWDNYYFYYFSKTAFITLFFFSCFSFFFFNFPFLFILWYCWLSILIGLFVLFFNVLLFLFLGCFFLKFLYRINYHFPPLISFFFFFLFLDLSLFF